MSLLTERPFGIMVTSTEDFIDIIRNYPALYDISHEDYTNKKLKNEIWENIALITHDSGGADSVKSKWKNLRDCYGKYLRASIPDATDIAKYTKRYKTWPWAAEMEFMKPFLEFSFSECKLRRRVGQKTSQIRSIHSPSTADTPLQKALKRRVSTPQESIDSYSYPRADLDETDLIFLGYSRTIKKMGLRRQAKLKFEIARLIMEAEVEHAEEKSPTYTKVPLSELKQ